MIGDNKCTERVNSYIGPRCCDQGFNASIGWDPVSGHGSPHFQKIYDYFAVEVFNQNDGVVPTLSPSPPPTLSPTAAPSTALEHTVNFDNVRAGD